MSSTPAPVPPVPDHSAGATADATADSAASPPTRGSRGFARRARWGVPAVAIVAVAGAIGFPLVSADASPSLPAKTAGQLLADVGSAQARPFSGTVVETARLGLPSLPNEGSVSSLSPLALLTGSHTVRIWSGGPQQTRLALVGQLSESDLVRNGSDLWLWSSQERTAEHIKLPAHDAKTDPAAAAKEKAMQSMTPAQAAAQALAAIDPTTAVTVDGTARVAGRSAYELVLKPRDTRSTVSSVRLAIDAKTDVPLRVQVFAKGHTAAAFETGFTSVTFTRPPASVFRFTAPPNTKLTTKDLSQVEGQAKGAAPSNAPKSLQDKTSGPASAAPTVYGTGWTSVYEISGVNLTGSTKSPEGQALMRSLKPVSGAYGSGRVFTTALLNVLLLDNGKAYVGAVPVSLLEAAATNGHGTPLTAK